jgi:F0F1-type ATP synthase assembly protein I
MAPSERRPLIVEARAYLTVYLAVTAGSIAAWLPAALVVWIVPWMVGQAFLRAVSPGRAHGLRVHA